MIDRELASESYNKIMHHLHAAAKETINLDAAADADFTLFSALIIATFELAHNQDHFSERIEYVLDGYEKAFEASGGIESVIDVDGAASDVEQATEN